MPMFTDELAEIIRAIPAGKVATYGQIARLAGNPRGARQVSRLLAGSSRKLGLPWHRVINSKGNVSLPPGGGLEEQCARLRAEGIKVSKAGRVSLSRYGWDGEP
ncbi:MAG: MGMT family protein [Candidatus Cloacimonetes bacterium]|nr:MGMT family protein [Candidatus Cloacimonadota bacterium]